MVIVYILTGLLAVFAAYVLFLILCALPVSPGKTYETNSPFYRRLLYSATAGALKLLRVRVHVSGAEKLPRQSSLLFVGNHRSNFDPIVTWHAFRKWNIAFVSKPENFRIPIFGRIIRRCCFLPIDRQDPRKAIVTINKAAALLEAGELSVGVYPEGTRSKDGTLLPFHNGVFKIARKAGAAVAVVSVRGTEAIHARTPFRATDVYLDVLDVIPADEVSGMKTEAVGTRVRQLLETTEK